jgi:hypothetical protein
VRRDTLIGIVTIIFVFATLFACTVIGAQKLDDQPVVSCMEDDPCWDCRTMGNNLCGIVPS